MLVGGFGGDITYFAGLPGGKFAAGEQLRFENGDYFLKKPIITDYLRKISPEEDDETIQNKLEETDAAAGIWVTDWDGDGDYDIVSGWFKGGLFVSRNNGTATEPKLSPQFELIHAGGKPLTEVFQTEPTIADWDGDGLDDLIYGTRDGIKTNPGSIYWCRNTANKGDPVYEAPRMLFRGDNLSQLVAPKFGTTRQLGAAPVPTVLDWDSDGDLDLLVGDYVSLQHAREDLTRKEYDQLLALRKQAAKHEKEVASLTGDARGQAHKKMWESRSAMQKYLKPFQRPTRKERAQRSVGRVWLLIRE